MRTVQSGETYPYWYHWVLWNSGIPGIMGSDVAVSVGVSFTTLDGPVWWNFILTCFSGGIVSPVCTIRSGETFVLLVSAARQCWNFTTCWIGKLWSKNSFCCCPVRKMFYCSSLLRSVVFLRKWKRIRIDNECSQKFTWNSRFVQKRCVFYTFNYSTD